MYDAAIVGTGPAGISAALNFKLHKKNIIWFGSKELSTKVEKSEKIANYPGLSMISGSELNARFVKQIEEMDIQLTEKLVTGITPTGNGFMVLGGNDIYETKTILLALGVVSAKGFSGEKKLLGHGVSYCASCDGFLYKDKKIAVFCADKRFEHEVEFLAELAKEVCLFTAYKDIEINIPNVMHFNQSIKEICGQDLVNKIILSDGTEISVEGVFVLRNAVAPSTLLKGLETDGPHIVVNKNMETNIKGCYAAGDCTGRPYQLTKSTGEGNIAAHSILEYLSELGKQA